jgi:hypothetical protein
MVNEYDYRVVGKVAEEVVAEQTTTTMQRHAKSGWTTFQVWLALISSQELGIK